MEAKLLAKYFDHTLLKPAATVPDIQKLCAEAVKYGFFSVCINPVHVLEAAGVLSRTEIKVCSVVGFPLGAHTTRIKAKEAGGAVADGADEVDMVINIGALKDGRYDIVENDIRAVVEAADGRLVKVILETCLLKKSEIIQACHLTVNAGAHFVKTSTGFAGGGATVPDVTLMRQTVGSLLQVKASGGIKTRADTLQLIKAGADRIGASAGVAIMNETINT